MRVENLSGISLFLLFSSLCLIAQAAVANDFVNDSCKKYKELSQICIDVIDSDPRQDLKSNLSGFLAIFINHSIANTNNNHLYLLEQIKRPELDNKTRQVFNKCLGHYEICRNILTSSLEVLLRDHDVKLDRNMADAYALITECENEFTGTPEPPSWSSRCLELFRLLKLSMMTANLLQ